MKMQNWGFPKISVYDALAKMKSTSSSCIVIVCANLQTIAC